MQRQVDSSTRLHVLQRARVRALFVILETAALTLFWTAIGAAVTRRSLFRGTFRAVALAGVIGTIGVLLRQAIAFGTGFDPGGITFAGPWWGDSWVATLLGSLDAFKIWWSAVAGACLALLWQRPAAYGVIFVLPATLLWSWFGHSH